MKYLAIILFIVLLFFSCKKEFEPQLSDEKMIDVLVDLHIAEGTMVSMNQVLKDSVSKVYYGHIFEIHQVNDSIFFQEFEILRNDSERIEEIYNQVFEKIEQLGIEKVKKEDPEIKK